MKPEYPTSTLCHETDPIFETRPTAASLSPQRGEGLRVRGGQINPFSLILTASPTSPASPVLDFQDAVPAPASPPKSYRAQNARLLTENSKIAGFGCCVISNNHPAQRPLLAAQETHVVRHPVPDCIALRRSRNRGNAIPSGVVGEICKRKIAGHGGWPRVSFLPKWIFCVAPVPVPLHSSVIGLAEQTEKFKRWVQPPLTLTLSPLRGEGTAGERELVNRSRSLQSHVWNKQPKTYASPCRSRILQAYPLRASLSPQRGEGLRVRGVRAETHSISKSLSPIR